MMGATAGRTTLNGEGLQHEDGHSHIAAMTIPNLKAYDPTFAYEIAVIIRDGLYRMYEKEEDIFYYLTLENENYVMPAMPDGCEEGILRGIYRFKESNLKKSQFKVHLLGSGAIMGSVMKAQEILTDQYNCSVDLWSVTSYKELRDDILEVERWNRLHPTAIPVVSYLEELLKDEEGLFLASSDYMKLLPEGISKWVPGGLVSLGTDGFGRSESRANLRRFFEVDAECIVLGTLYELHKRGKIEAEVVEKAIKDLGIDADKPNPVVS
jgi:pyruvate dehydrogenase E1 component